MGGKSAREPRLSDPTGSNDRDDLLCPHRGAEAFEIGLAAYERRFFGW
ncbi:MAG: hypothetical protein PXZ07_00995 [Candidatus Eremiobacteraeota bacterium]|nr:hypothetical protein [Candidatus Eremiobacteraeota bacterium]